ncbi:hypothetical protein GUI12_04180 [Anaplasmataceae bacterium AB001_6]|nr:hypothetical protein GUI12_04180 [Anaplasmataceae bacterium AB001_6]
MSRTLDDVKEVFIKLSFAKANETVGKIFTKKVHVAPRADLTHTNKKSAKGFFFSKKKNNKINHDELSAIRQELEQQRQAIIHDREMIEETHMILEKAKMDAQKKILEKKKRLQRKEIKKYDEINGQELDVNQDNTVSDANLKEEE